MGEVPLYSGESVGDTRLLNGLNFVVNLIGSWSKDFISSLSLAQLHFKIVYCVRETQILLVYKWIRLSLGYYARVIFGGEADQSSHKVTLIMRWRPKCCAKSSGQPLLGLPRSRIRI